MKNFGPISYKINSILHGADYNPDQWLDKPEIINEDYELIKMANCNVVSINMFSWASLEPKEDDYNFEWLDKTINDLYDNGIHVILSTPSGAKPNWMADKYPEILRVNEGRTKSLKGGRHNHCYTSPVYRQKVEKINTLLAKRYKDHPAIIMWHISNEYEGNCHCELCQNAFREWLKVKYNNDLDVLNKAWWTKFWSHTYTDWNQIESPSTIGEIELHGLNLDWKRFVTYQTLNFYKHEIKPFKEITPDIPVTTNMHDYINIFNGLNYWEFAPFIDVISWDNYPYWHTSDRENYNEAARRGFIHDMNRSFKRGKPFMMMESSPSATNWQPVAKLRRPGMHSLASIQAIAHGSDTVQYFQWRKSLGSSEKFHGAVVDHYSTPNTRVFKEVSSLGADLKKLSEVIGTSVDSEVAIIYDWENYWAMKDSQGPRREKLDYFDTCVSHYEAFWKSGISVDIINMETDLSKYKLVIAPMLYMVKEKTATSIERFVKSGGIFVTTYLSGIANENDLCFTTGRPGPLRDIMGIWSEEIDALYDGEKNTINIDSNFTNRDTAYQAEILCDLIHAENAKVLGRYTQDFYAGYPALTVNNYDDGYAYYIAFRSYDEFLEDFYKKLIKEHNIEKSLNIELPLGVTVQKREDDKNTFYFIQNYTSEEKEINLDKNNYIDIINSNIVSKIIKLKPYGYKILKESI